MTTAKKNAEPGHKNRQGGHKCSVVANIARSQWCLKKLFVQTAGRGQLAVREKTSSRICTAQTIPLLIRCLNGCLL